MPNLLTLGITETRPESEEYKILSMDILSNTFFDIDLKLDEIIQGNDKIWDLGGVTEVDNLVKIEGYNNNCTYLPQGDIRFNRQYSRKELKKLLKENCISLGDFYNSNMKHGIVRVDYLDDIIKPEYDNHTFKSYVRVTAQGETKRILNKDFRWINYWKSIHEKDCIQDKINYFKDLINDSTQQDIFMIMYRHNYKNGQGRWIAGIHWL